MIDALNADKPYNRFVAEQVEGDLAPKATPDMQTAVPAVLDITTETDASVKLYGDTQFGKQ